MKQTIIPTMSYKNPKLMVEWLEEAFGFTPHALFDDGEGGVVHAELKLGDALIMLGLARDNEFGAIQSAPDPNSPVTQSAYIVVSDVDGILDRARKAGADIVYGPNDEEYGGRGFTCRDPEGQVWNFGTFDPWAVRNDKGE